MNKFLSIALLATLASAFDGSVRVLPGGDMDASMAPTMGPTMAPTMAPTLAPSMMPTMAPTMSLLIPEDERCVQTVIPPGVKPGSCMVTMCIPTSVMEGETFHTTVRFCLQRPRKWHLTFGLLDERTKEYYGGAGTGIYETRSQCAEHTFEYEFNAKAIDGVYDVMWKFYVTTNHGTAEEYLEDSFPNMIAEAGIPQQPAYDIPLANDCEVVPTRMWNLPPTGKQDGIEWFDLPECFTSGEEWITNVATHLESQAFADLHCNLQIGTGGDKYLGDEDVYITETNMYNIAANPKTDDWDDIPEDYWTNNEIVYTAEQTALVEDGARVYLACFLVAPMSQYDPTLPLGWDFIDREFFLKIEHC